MTLAEIYLWQKRLAEHSREKMIRAKTHLTFLAIFGVISFVLNFTGADPIVIF